MPKHETRNTYYQITLGSKNILVMKFGQFMSYTKKLSNNFTKMCPGN